MKTQSLLEKDGSPPDKLIATAAPEPPEKAISKYEKPKSNLIKYLIILIFIAYLINMVLR